MGLGSERKRPRRSMATDFDIVRAVLADRYAFVRQVGYRQQAAVATLLNAFELDGELLDLLRPLTIGLLNRGAVQSLSLRPRDFVGRSVLFPLEAFELRQYPTSSGLERGEIFELAR